jgi:phosphate transport system permease protein
VAAARLRAARIDRAAGLGVVGAAGVSVLLVLLVIVFLAIRALPVFTSSAIGAGQFFTSTNWAPDLGLGFGAATSSFGALAPIWGSLCVVGLALVIAVPLAISLALVVAETDPVVGGRFLRPAIELFVGIPSVVYGYLGFAVLLPLLKTLAPSGADGSGILAASIVLSIMIVPTIATLSTDGLLSVPRSLKEASLALGATQWQTMRRVLLPSARASIVSGIVLGLARAMGEALAVALVIGDVNVIPSLRHDGIRALLRPFTTMTVTITDGVQNLSINPDGTAARYMLALVLLAITFVCIVVVRFVNRHTPQVTG